LAKAHRRRFHDRLPVPLEGKNDVALYASVADLPRRVTLAQAEAYAT
jgi:hypothetical protein